LAVLLNFGYLLILFRERVRKPPAAPGWLAALDARFDVTALEIQPNVAAVAFRPRSRILFIN
jgi:hypothetical protein